MDGWMDRWINECEKWKKKRKIDLFEGSILERESERSRNEIV
jgi:hypothetical protein